VSLGAAAEHSVPKVRLFIRLFTCSPLSVCCVVTAAPVRPQLFCVADKQQLEQIVSELISSGRNGNSALPTSTSMQIQANA